MRIISNTNWAINAKQIQTVVYQAHVAVEANVCQALYALEAKRNKMISVILITNVDHDAVTLGQINVLQLGLAWQGVMLMLIAYYELQNMG